MADEIMSDEQVTPGLSRQDETNALLPRLRVIEDQPLDRRADAFAQIHDQLRATLEGGDAQ